MQANWTPKTYAQAAAKINQTNPLYLRIEGHEVKEVNLIAKLFFAILRIIHFYSDKDIFDRRSKLFRELNWNYRPEIKKVYESILQANQNCRTLREKRYSLKGPFILNNELVRESNPQAFAMKYQELFLNKKLGVTAELVGRVDGFVVKEPDNGSCLFYSLADGLRTMERNNLPDDVLTFLGDKEALAQYLRSMAQAYISGAKDDKTVKMFIEQQIVEYNSVPNRPPEDCIQGVDDYIELLADPSFYASGLEVFALSKVLNMGIGQKVEERDRSGIILPQYTVRYPDEACDPDLWIVFTPSRRHYEAFFPKPEIC